MSLVRFLFRTSKMTTLAIALSGLVAGLCSAGLIALVNTAIHRDSISVLLITAVILAALTRVAATAASKWLMARFALTTFLDLTVDLCRQVMRVPFRRLEQTGVHRIFTALTNDTNVLVAAAQAIPNLAVNASVVLGCGIYLAWLYPLGFVLLCGVVVFGVAVYLPLHTTAFKAIQGQRERRDQLTSHYKGLVDGIKELKMHNRRGEEFLQRIDATAKDVRRL